MVVFWNMRKKSSAIGIKIEEARKKAGLSRRKFMLCLKRYGVDVTEATIFNWESGVTVPTADRILIIAKALKSKPDFFWS